MPCWIYKLDIQQKNLNLDRDMNHLVSNVSRWTFEHGLVWELERQARDREIRGSNPGPGSNFSLVKSNIFLCCFKVSMRYYFTIDANYFEMHFLSFALNLAVIYRSSCCFWERLDSLLKGPCECGNEPPGSISHRITYLDIFTYTVNYERHLNLIFKYFIENILYTIGATFLILFDW